MILVLERDIRDKTWEIQDNQDRLEISRRRIFTGIYIIPSDKESTKKLNYYQNNLIQEVESLKKSINEINKS